VLDNLRTFTRKVGMARLIIALFLLALLVIAPFAGLRMDLTISDMITRFGMYAVLILSLIPMIQSGCGLNFGLPLGVVAGTFGAICSVELQIKGLPGILAAMAIGIIAAALIGYAYGKLLNRVKGEEQKYAGRKIEIISNLYG
jgi:simple sugar transport system permease protein